MTLLLPPALFLIEQAPASLGSNEIYLGLILIFLTAGSFLAAPPESRKPSRNEFIFLTIFSVFLLVNFWEAKTRHIPFLDWLRGAIPFFICFIFWPLYRVLARDKVLRGRFFLSCFALVLSYALQVIAVFLFYKLYQNNIYLIQENDLILIDKSLVESYPKTALAYAVKRVTLLLGECNNPLVGTGSLFGSWLFLFGKERLTKYGGLILSIFSTVAVTLTMTRSFLLAVGCSLFFMLVGIVIYRRDLLKKYAANLTLLASVFFITIVSADLMNIYISRFINQLSFTNDTIASPNLQPSSIVSPPPIGDIDLRLEECKIAFNLFSSSPFIGAGFGIKHTIRFDGGLFNNQEKEVAYIHNWFFYMLMCGGIIGTLLYSVTLLYPFVWAIHYWDTPWGIAVGMLISFLATYGFFFAVFRLMTFNFLLALCWVLIYSFSPKIGSRTYNGDKFDALS